MEMGFLTYIILEQIVPPGILVEQRKYQESD